MKITTTVEKELTWPDLKKAAIEGTLDSIIKTGDLIPFNLKTGEKAAVRVTQDRNDKWFFVSEGCIGSAHWMNANCVNRGGWEACEMRKYLNKTVFDLLPDELQQIIVPTRIVQVLDDERVETEDKLFLPSKTQMSGKGAWSDLEPEDAKFIYFCREKDRVKEYGRSTWLYFLRTPYSDNTSDFYFVSSSGAIYNNSAGNRCGVVPCFCIS